MTRGSFLAAASIALVLATGATGSPTWSAETQISIGDRALGPELALNTHGEALVIWDQEVGDACTADPASLFCSHRIEVTDGDSGSGTWRSPIEISRPGVGARPRVAVDPSGNGAALWVHDIGRDRVVQASYRNGPVGSWPEPNDISEASLEVGAHEIALDGQGNAVGVWSERKDTTFAVRSATRLASTGGWGAAVTLSTPGTNVSAGPSFALGPLGLGMAAWVESGEVRCSLTSVVGWQTSVTVSHPGTVVDGAPTVAVDSDGDSIVVWPAQRGTTAVVEAAFFDRRANSWTEPAEVGVRLSAVATPAATIDDHGNVDVAWIGARGVESASRSKALGTWSQPVRVSARSETPSAVTLAVFGLGNAVALWQTSAGHLEASLRPRSTGWQAPVDVSPGGAVVPQVALDAEGRAVAVWSRSSGDRVSVQAAVLDGKGPILDRLVAPKRALAVGARTRFSIHAAPWGAPLVSTGRWVFGDGSSRRGFSVSHTYPRAGLYRVTFSLPDARGDVSTATTSVRVVAPMENVRRPRIAGNTKVGATLTCHRGVWKGSPPVTYAYRWRRNGKPIRDEISRHHLLVPQDTAALVTCVVSATNPGGTARARSAGVVVRA